MIFIDCETTGLLAPEGALTEQQPHIIEFAAVKVKESTTKRGPAYSSVGEISFLCKPPIALPPEITKITGITQSDLHDKVPFRHHIHELANFFIGEEYLIAHNLSFDLGCMKHELIRLNAVTRFPWPPKQICTVEASKVISGARVNLTDLYKMATGKDHINSAHRAINDVEALIDCFFWLKKKGYIKL
jgi:DNA polymerase III epsilon subunit-like protein